MLGKLIKYEWKACARVCLPLYLVALATALIARLMGTESAQDVVGGIGLVITGTVYFGIIIAMFVVTFVILIQRFYKSLLGDEGYLMFTLPVTVSQHIWAKTIIAFVMNLLCGLAAFLSIAILAANTEIIGFFQEFFDEVAFYLRGNPDVILIILEFLLLWILSSVSGIMYIYLCISVGHLAKKNRVAMAVGAYFGISILQQIIMAFISSFDRYGLTGNLLAQINRLGSDVFNYHPLLLGSAVIDFIYIAIYFLVIRYILTNKLNLD